MPGSTFSSRVIAIAAAAVVGVGSIVAISTGGPSTQQPNTGGGGADTANLWAATSPGSGCTRSGSQVAYNTATDCTLAAACTAAQGGDVVRLQSGSYGEFGGCAKSSPGVTFTPASGASPIMTLGWGYDGDAWMILDGINIGGGVSEICGGTSHVTLKNAEVSSYLNVSGNLGGGAHCTGSASFNNSAIQIGPGLTFTLDDYDGVTSPTPWLSGGQHEGRLTMDSDDDGTTATGIVVTGNTFTGNVDGTPSCADGIQSNTGGWTATGNRFQYLWQSSCNPHVDGVQFFRGNNAVWKNVTLSNNYLSDGASGFVDYDDAGDSMTITNNVFARIPGFDPGDGGSQFNPCGAICIKGTTNEVVTHNTVIEEIGGTTNNAVQIGSSNGGAGSTGAIVRDNIFPEPVATNGSFSFTQDHNWCITGTCTGTGSLNGAPTPSWVGGSTSTTYAGFALTGGSRGTSVASDGTNIGVNP